MTEEAFNRSENISIAIIQSGEQRVKYVVKHEQRLKNMWDRIKSFNITLIIFQEETKEIG